MKFLIKTSAVGVSDEKSVSQGEYETTNEKEIERLKAIAKKFPEDVEVVTGKKKDEKQSKENKDSKEAKKESKEEEKTDQNEKK